MPEAKTLTSQLLARISAGAERLMLVGDIPPDLVAKLLARQPGTIVEHGRIRPGADAEDEFLSFDAAVLVRCLEKASDPLALLSRLYAGMTDGGVCTASIDNANSWPVLAQQLRGRDPRRGAGNGESRQQLLTLDTALALFRQGGWTVVDVHPQYPADVPEAASGELIATLARELGLKRERVKAELSAQRWLIRAVKGPKPEPLSLVALGLKKVAGVTEARVDYPMAALATQPSVRAVWGAESVAIPEHWPPGVLVLHRQFMNDPAIQAAMENLVTRGWLLVADMDDDPHHWREYGDSGFYAYRGVHAVSVSTEPLAEMIRQWNPKVRVFANAIHELPEMAAATPKGGGRLRVFFGALNRYGDCDELLKGIAAISGELAGRVEFVVVHDRGFHDALPEGIPREFHETLPPDNYMKVLASCDLALLPLADNQFNRLKSDLKFIECCAAGAVPICSPVVYGDVEEHREIAVFATSAGEWSAALVMLCSDGDEIARRKALGRHYVETRRMHCHQLVEREAWYRELRASRGQLEQQRRARIAALREVR